MLRNVPSSVLLALGLSVTWQSAWTAECFASGPGIEPVGQPTAAAADDDTDRRAYLTANGLLNRGLFELAIPEYRQFLSKHPGHESADMARYGLAVCLYRTGKHAEAIRELTHVAPKSTFVYVADANLLMGHCRLALEQFPAAAEAFAAVVTHHADHASAPSAGALWVEALYRAGEHAPCAAAASAVVERWPNAPQRGRTELFWGLSESSRDEWEAAAPHFERVLEDEASVQLHDQATLLLGRARHRANRLDDAASLYERVIEAARAGREEADPFVPEAQLGLAQIRYAAGEAGAASALLDAMLTGEADAALLPSALFLRGRIRFDEGDLEAAGADFRRINPKDADLADDAAYWSAKCALRAGDARGAAGAFERALRAYPDSELAPEMRYDRAVALSRAGDDKGAAAAFDEFLSRHADHRLAPEALYALAADAHRKARYDDSLALCDRFASRHADHALTASVAFLAAENDYLAGRFDLAETRYRAILAAPGDDAKGRRAAFRLGMALHHQHKDAEAEPHLRSVVNGDQTEEPFRPALQALGDAAFTAGRWDQAEAYLRDYLSFGDGASGAEDAALKRGLALARRDRHADALAVFDQILAAYPKGEHRAQAGFERGQALMAMGRDAEAVQAFERTAADPSAARFAPYAMNHLGGLARKRGDLSSAERWFGRAAASASAAGVADLAAQASLDRSLVLVAAKDHAGAARALSAWVEAHPDHAATPRARAHLAIALSRQGDGEAALAAIDDALGAAQGAVDPPLVHSLMYERAWCLRHLDRDDEAAQAYEALLAASPVDSLRTHAMLELAAIRMDAEGYEAAAVLLSELRSLIESASAPPAPELAEQTDYRLAVCRLKLGKHDQVGELLADFSERYEDSPLVPSASLLCAQAMTHLGRHAQATPHLQRVVDRFRGHEAYKPALLRLGESLAAQQLWKRSEDSFLAFLSEFPDDELWFQARFGVAFARENQSRFPEAIADYIRIVEEHDGPTAARAQFQIGECLYAQKKYDEAARELMRVDILYAYPQWSAAALYEAGRCFVELGRPDQAREQFNAVVERFPETDWANLAKQSLAGLAKAAPPPPPR